MKLLLLLLSISFGVSAISQSDSKLWFKTGPTVNYMRVEHRIEADVPRDATFQGDQKRRVTEDLGFGARMQLGYQINSRWSAGIQAGAFVSAWIDYILPRFYAVPQMGGFGSYHFTNRFALMGQVNFTRSYPEKNGMSFGLAPEFTLGKQENVVLRLSAEYFYRKKMVDYRAVQTNFNTGETQIFEGSAPKFSRGALFEVGVLFRIR